MLLFLFDCSFIFISFDFVLSLLSGYSVSENQITIMCKRFLKGEEFSNRTVTNTRGYEITEECRNKIYKIKINEIDKNKDGENKLLETSR